jgi:hypothetical protein
VNIILPPTPSSSALPTANLGAAHFIILDLITLNLYIDKENPRFISPDHNDRFVEDALPRMAEEFCPCPEVTNNRGS